MNGIDILKAMDDLTIKLKNREVVINIELNPSDFKKLKNSLPPLHEPNDSEGLDSFNGVELIQNPSIPEGTYLKYYKIDNVYNISLIPFDNDNGVSICINSIFFDKRRLVRDFGIKKYNALFDSYKQFMFGGVKNG